MFKNEKKYPLKDGQLSIIEKYWQLNFVEKNVSKIPKKIETHHLTLSTILWSLIIIICGYLGQYNIHWLWGATAAILLQYFTDIFDGAVGRYRDTGLVKWGYYMDHFLDYIFLCSVLIAYSFIFNDRFNSLFFILAIFGAFMVNAYLFHGATNKFNVTYFRIGPTEIRLLFIIINTMTIFFHKVYLSYLLPYVLIFSLFCLIIIVFKTQKIVWQYDMKNKTEKK